MTYIIHNGAPDDPRPENEMAVYRFLTGLHIPFIRIDHGPVQTMEDCQAIDAALGGEICKNLFLCNQQKTQFYLLMISHPETQPAQPADPVLRPSFLLSVCSFFHLPCPFAHSLV